MTEPALRLQGLIAGYDGVPVVHGLTLEVAPGEVVALLGANGAGKTTTLLTVSGLLPRLGGEISLLGEPVPQRTRGQARSVVDLARRGLAHVPEDRALFYDLSVRDNIRMGMRRRQPAADLDAVVDHFGALAPILDRAAGLLSGGEQQMLAMARALVGQPKVLLVDEMSLGLAPIIVERLLPTLRSVAEAGAAVLVVEQHVSLLLSTADRAYVMRRGEITVEGAAAELAARPELLEAGYLGTADTTL